MEHLDALHSLLEADRRCERVRAQRDHLPEQTELAEVEAQLRTLLAALKQAQAVHDPLASAYQAAHQSAASLVERRDRLRKTLDTSTGGARELESITHELDSVTNAAAEAEDVELSLLLELEPAAQQVDVIKGQAQPLVARRADLQATIAGLVETLNEELASLLVDRDTRSRAVPEPWRARYEGAAKRVSGAGAALVHAGRCDGCRIALSPLDLDRFKATVSGELMECPSCGRWLLP